MILHFNIIIFPCRREREWRSRLQTGRSGLRTPVGARVLFLFFLSRPDRLLGSSGHQFIGNRFFPGGKLAGASLRPRTSSQRRGQEWELPLCAVMAWAGTFVFIFTFTFIPLTVCHFDFESIISLFLSFLSTGPSFQYDAANRSSKFLVT